MAYLYLEPTRERQPNIDPGLQVRRPKPSTVGTVAVSPVPLVDRAHAAEYVAALTAELAILVRRHHLHTLGYLLDLARLEAEEVVQKGTGAAPAPDSKATQPSGQRK